MYKACSPVACLGHWPCTCRYFCVRVSSCWLDQLIWWGKREKKMTFSPLNLNGGIGTSPGKIAYSFPNVGAVEEEEGDGTSKLLFDGGLIAEKLAEELVSEETAAKVLDKLPGKNMGKIEGNAGKVSGKMPSQVRSYADTMKNSKDPGAWHHLSFEQVEEEVITIMLDEFWILEIVGDSLLWHTYLPATRVKKDFKGSQIHGKYKSK